MVHRLINLHCKSSRVIGANQFGTQFGTAADGLANRTRSSRADVGSFGVFSWSLLWSLGAQLLLIGSWQCSRMVNASLCTLLWCASVVDLVKLALLLKRLISLGEEDEQEEILQIFLIYFLAFSSSGYGPAFSWNLGRRWWQLVVNASKRRIFSADLEFSELESKFWLKKNHGDHTPAEHRLVTTV